MSDQNNTNAGVVEGKKEENVEKISLLFVDDDKKILQGIKRSFHSQRKCWDMEFANSGLEALEYMAENDVDVIISDIQMPGMTGVELLQRVKKSHPRVLRMALSGETGKKLGYSTARSVHQFLAKPVSMESLKVAIEKSRAMQKEMASEVIQEKVSEMEYLPSLPSLYTEIINIIESPTSSMKQVADAISKDLAMTAKLLQLANSAFFGIGSRINSIKQAVTMLGLELVADLVLTVHLFGAYDQKPIPGFSIDQLWKEGLETARIGSLIAKDLRLKQEIIDFAFLTGILHDIGRLILAINFRDEFIKSIKLRREKKCTDWKAEVEVFGTSHAEVGAYLGGMWAFPSAVIEGIAYHHHPLKVPEGEEISPLTAVHCAMGLIYKKNTGKDILLDKEYLRKKKISHKLDSWMKL